MIFRWVVYKPLTDPGGLLSTNSLASLSALKGAGAGLLQTFETPRQKSTLHSIIIAACARKERKKREYSAEFASPFIITRIFVGSSIGGGSNWDENQVREKV